MFTVIVWSVVSQRARLDHIRLTTSHPLTDSIDFWLLGDVFLKNVYSVHRVDPPALGFAKLK